LAPPFVKVEMEIIEKGKYSYSIEFKNSNIKNQILLKALLQSKLLGAGTTMTPNFNKINFNATNITTLKTLLEKYKKERNIAKLNYDETSQLLNSLSSQIHYLENLNHTFYNFSLDKILIITKNSQKIFIYVNIDDLMTIENKSITFITPFDLKLPFLDPEIKKLCTLPSKVNSKCIYYSLGCLGLYCLSSDFGENDHERKLEQIKHTKLYWEILRYMDKDFENRKPNFF
jgi:hypothetical protein